jgi:t-SNARE complex subunit (syntaxin)
MDQFLLASSPSNRAEHARLTHALQSLVAELDQTLQGHLDLERSALESRRSRLIEDDNQVIEPSAAITDSLLRSLAEADLREEILAEREQGILQIHQDVLNLRGLFSQVALHVDQQGVLLDNIEANIESANVQATSASNELRRTERASSSSHFPGGKCPLILLLVLVVIGLLAAFR